MIGRTALAILLALGAAAAEADVESADRPRVALVLSGGGARGAAHIGVLKELERRRVPIDLIVGTSMGAFVGGLYASGYSPAEIERVVREADWQDFFTDRPPRKNISFRRKQDDDKPLFQFELGVDADGLTLPSGLVAGQKLGFLLRSLTLHTTGIRDFQRLPVPFRAVATDLDTGERVVLSTGDLPEAIRASMAVPGVLTPVDIDGRTLVDGGLIMNLPVGVALELGAERILAVDVTSEPRNIVEERSVVGVAVQTLSLLTARNVQEQRAKIREGDLLILPDLLGIQMTSFEKLDDAIEKGTLAAKAQAGALDAFATTPDEFEVFLQRQRRESRVGPAGVTIDEVQVTGVERVDARIVKARLRTRPGAGLDLAVLRADLDRIYRVGEFQQVDFNVSEQGESTRLIIDTEEKSWGPRYLRFGLALEANFEGHGEFTALADFTQTHLNALGAESKTLLRIGDEDSIFTEFFQPLDFSGFSFVAPQFGYRRNQFRFVDASAQLVEADTQRINLGLDFGVQFQHYGEVRLGALAGRLDAELRSPLGVDEFERDVGGLILSVTIDQLDNANFPRSGSFMNLQGFLSRSALGADEGYDRGLLSMTHAGSFGRHTIVSQQRVGTDFGSDLPFYDEFRLGGFLNLSGLAPGQLQGDLLGYANLIYLYRIGSLPSAIGGGVYAGAAVEAGNVWSDFESAEFGDLRPAASIFTGMDTLLGPLYLAYGRADGGEDSFYLFVGRLF